MWDCMHVIPFNHRYICLIVVSVFHAEYINSVFTYINSVFTYINSVMTYI